MHIDLDDIDNFQVLYVTYDEKGNLIPYIHSSLYLKNGEPIHSFEMPFQEALNKMVEMNNFGEIDSEAKHEIIDHLRAISSIISNKIKELQSVD